MRLPHGRFSDVLHNLLYSLMMGGDSLDIERLVVDSDLVPVKLKQVPENARYAQVVLEADPTSVTDITCRYLQCPPRFDTTSGRFVEQLSRAVGMPLDNKAVTEIKDTENLRNFRILNMEPNKTNILMVEYFG